MFKLKDVPVEEIGACLRAEGIDDEVVIIFQGERLPTIPIIYIYNYRTDTGKYYELDTAPVATSQKDEWHAVSNK